MFVKGRYLDSVAALDTRYFRRALVTSGLVGVVDVQLIREQSELLEWAARHQAACAQIQASKASPDHLATIWRSEESDAPSWLAGTGPRALLCCCCQACRSILQAAMNLQQWHCCQMMKTYAYLTSIAATPRARDGSTTCTNCARAIRRVLRRSIGRSFTRSGAQIDLITGMKTLKLLACGHVAVSRLPVENGPYAQQRANCSGFSSTYRGTDIPEATH